MKDAVSGKESEGRKSMTVRVTCERTERLRRCDHGRDGFLKRGELCLEELERGGVSRAAKVPVEVTVVGVLPNGSFRHPQREEAEVFLLISCT